ncbi:hypothetical protein [Streptomyces mirabilis]|uniref:hypothetical protein n=1 Tax=Streptomyces mirabilis TaxID=68239 RepID=UPI0033DCB605
MRTADGEVRYIAHDTSRRAPSARTVSRVGGARLCWLVKAGKPAGQKRFAANDQ